MRIRPREEQTCITTMTKKRKRTQEFSAMAKLEQTRMYNERESEWGKGSTDVEEKETRVYSNKKKENGQ